MSAFFIATVTIKDNEKFQEYGKQAATTFGAYEGEPLVRGKYVASYNQGNQHHATAIVRFPSIEQMDAWYNSPEYQAIIPLRDEAADIIFSQYQIPA